MSKWIYYSGSLLQGAAAIKVDTLSQIQHQVSGKLIFMTPEGVSLTISDYEAAQCDELVADILHWIIDGESKMGNAMEPSIYRLPEKK